MLGFKETSQLIERNIIEVVPLAFMRGRTLNNSFIILDESQNATVEQMKMFLTRFGFGSKVVVTGDITQIDLPKDTLSGLVHSLKVLKNIDDVGLVEFDSKDVVRHGLVQKIVEAYGRYDK
jgi:phosphate starvation-inducible PhoH-like protein